jgi:hypothetical protein
MGIRPVPLFYEAPANQRLRPAHCRCLKIVVSRFESGSRHQPKVLQIVVF